MLRLIFLLHFDVGGGHAIFPDLFGRKLPAGDLEASQFGAEVFDAAACVNQRAERHVAANARKTIEISEFHGMPPRGWDCRLKRLSAGCRLILSAGAECVKRAKHQNATVGASPRSSGRPWANAMPG